MGILASADGVRKEAEAGTICAMAVQLGAHLNLSGFSNDVII